MRISIPLSRYSSAAQRAAFYGGVLDRIRALPEVISAGAVNLLPVTGGDRRAGLQIEGHPVQADADWPIVRFRIATPGYLRSMGTPLLSGRDFLESDVNTEAVTTGAVAISESLAAKFWPAESPVGRQVRVRIDNVELGPLTVVGVVGDIRQFVDSPAEPTLYWASLRQPSYTLVVRTGSDPARLVEPIQQGVLGVDAAQPISDAMTMSDRLANAGQVTRGRLYATLMIVFGGTALLLAMLGIFGVVQYSVAQRIQEFGVRMALGATPANLLRLALRESLTLVTGGLAAGIGCSLPATRILARALYGVRVTEPLILVGTAISLTAAATLASWIPARRAARVDPMVALRCE